MNNNDNVNSFVDNETIENKESFMKTCTHPEHEPPSFLTIPFGFKKTHICPNCKKRTVISNNICY